MQNLESIMRFISECEKLKTTYRYGVKNDGQKESTAEHSWRLVLMVLLIWEEIWININLFKAVKIAIVHDLAEVVTWDIDAHNTYKDKELKKQKEKDELRAMNYLKNIIWWELWEEVFNCWQEYEDWATKEALFVKALDKIETLNQFCDAWIDMFDELEFIALYADKHIKKVPELKPILGITKKNLKNEYIKWWKDWKDEWDKN